MTTCALERGNTIIRFLEEFKNTEFTYTLEETLDNYLSCDIQMDYD